MEDKYIILYMTFEDIDTHIIFDFAKFRILFQELSLDQYDTVVNSNIYRYFENILTNRYMYKKAINCNVKISER